MPPEASIVATYVFPLLQVPPGVASVSNIELPIQTTIGDDPGGDWTIDAISETVTLSVATHPATVVKVIVYMPVADAVARPDDGSIVKAGSLLLHVPDEASV
jgi:hypothetical protein